MKPGKEVLTNDGLVNLALGISGTTTIALSNADYTLTTDNQGEAMHMILVLTGTLTASLNVIVPAEGRVYVVDNRCSGAFTVTFKTATGGGIAAPQGERSFIFCDGADVFPVGTSGGGGGDGAPTDASYLVSVSHSLLTGERVVTDTATVTWDHSTAGQSKAQVPDGAVTYAKLQDVASSRLLGRYSAGSGMTQEVSLGEGLILDSSGVLAAPGTGSGAPGGASGQVQYNNAGGFGGSSGLTLSATQVTAIDLASPLPLTEGGTGAVNATTARANLGLVIGTNVQAADATLTALAGVSTGADTLPYFTGVDAALSTPLTAFARSLLDDADAATARTTLAIPAAPGAASETVAGITRYGTPAETTTGTLTTVATHPAGVKAALDARVPAGPPLSVARYDTAGVTLEGSGWVIDANQNLSNTTTTINSTVRLLMVGDSTSAGVLMTRHADTVASPTINLQKSRGSEATPTVVLVNDQSGNINMAAYGRNAGDTADTMLNLSVIRGIVQSVDAQNRLGGALLFFTSSGASAVATEKVRITQEGHLLITTGELQTAGARVNYSLAVYASGAAYALTATPALLDFGTTDPSLVLDKAGTYMLSGRVALRYNAATFAANRTVTLKIRRTNNTAADLANASITVQTEVVTTHTGHCATAVLPLIVYPTATTTDILQLFGSMDVVPSAGSLDAFEASLVATRLY